jgi:hypothetical protein
MGEVQSAEAVITSPEVEFACPRPKCERLREIPILRLVCILLHVNVAVLGESAAGRE